MTSNDEYLWRLLSLDNKDIVLLHLNRPLPDGRFATGHMDMLKNMTDWHQRDAVVLVSHEAQLSLDLIKKLPPNVLCFDSVGNIDHEQYGVYFNYFRILQKIETNNPVLRNLLPYTKKSPEYTFDCLLGHVRSHRDFVYNNVHASAFKDQTLVSYFGKTKTWIPGGDVDDAPELKAAANSFDKQLPINLNNLDNSQMWVYYDQPGNPCMMSQLLPWRIYNNSWYSVVTETYPNRAFYTEKTAKVLMAGRIFVMFSGVGALRGLRQAGFQTFGSIIDESYDEIEDDVTRFIQAWQQVERLVVTDPYETYQKVNHIVQHNQQHIMNTDWDNQFVQRVYKFLDLKQ